jgi:hypothetical protein
MNLPKSLEFQVLEFGIDRAKFKLPPPTDAAFDPYHSSSSVPSSSVPRFQLQTHIQRPGLLRYSSIVGTGDKQSMRRRGKKIKDIDSHGRLDRYQMDCRKIIEEDEIHWLSPLEQIAKLRLSCTRDNCRLSTLP